MVCSYTVCLCSHYCQPVTVGLWLLLAGELELLVLGPAQGHSYMILGPARRSRQGASWLAAVPDVGPNHNIGLFTHMKLFK